MLRRRTPLRPAARLKRSVGTRKRPASTGPSREVIHLLVARSGGLCEHPACGRPAQDPHHRDERGMGGRGVKAPAWINLPSNLLAACRGHNNWASNVNPAAARDMGWLIPSGLATPYNTPVLTRHHPRPVLLDDTGRWTPINAGSDVHLPANPADYAA